MDEGYFSIMGEELTASVKFALYFVAVAIFPFAVSRYGLGFDMTLSTILTAFSTLAIFGIAAYVRMDDFPKQLREKTRLGMGGWILMGLVYFGGLLFAYFQAKPDFYCESVRVTRGCLNPSAYLSTLYLGGVMLSFLSYPNRERAHINWIVLAVLGVVMAVGGLAGIIVWG